MHLPQASWQPRKREDTVPPQESGLRPPEAAPRRPSRPVRGHDCCANDDCGANDDFHYLDFDEHYLDFDDDAYVHTGWQPHHHLQSML